MVPHKDPAKTTALKGSILGSMLWFPRFGGPILRFLAPGTILFWGATADFQRRLTDNQNFHRRLGGVGAESVAPAGEACRVRASCKGLKN